MSIYSGLQVLIAIGNLEAKSQFPSFPPLRVEKYFEECKKSIVPRMTGNQPGFLTPRSNPFLNLTISNTGCATWISEQGVDLVSGQR